LNKDLKSKLKEKMGALVTDEQLEKVAGGTYEQNLEILVAMANIDPENVQKVFSKINAEETNPRDIGFIISQGAANLILKHFHMAVATSNDLDNRYIDRDGSNLNQDQMLKMIKDKAAQNYL